ncbi:hypothetical protein IMSAGC013_04545 [Lachnospiraceae bacterium]|nr:hypothetical protein IMSAGC013_04545 [Lachnospiraceae bacterium]
MNRKKEMLSWYFTRAVEVTGYLKGIQGKNLFL